MHQASIRPIAIIGSTVFRFARCSTCLIIRKKMNHSLHRMQSKIRINNALSVNSINSYLGAMSHYSSYNIRKSIVTTITKTLTFNPELTKVNLKQHNGRKITETNKNITI